MTDDEIVAARIVEVVSRAIALDVEAVQALFEHRTSCNELLLADETIQARDNGRYRTVGVFGLLSGIAGVHPGTSYSRIEAEWSVRCPRHSDADGVAGSKCPVDGCSYRLVPCDLLRVQLSKPPEPEKI